MNSIQYYLHNHDNELANAYLADFARLIRMTMEDAVKAFITLEKEISRLTLYLSLEQLRFGDDLSYEIRVDPLVMTADVYIPNMILQPYIENAIWHGIMPKKSPSKLLILISAEENEQVKITIEDDGVGFRQEHTQQPAFKKGSFGKQITEDRLDLLNKLLGKHYSVTTRPGVDANGEPRGTIVEILITARPLVDAFSQIEQEFGEE